MSFNSFFARNKVQHPNLKYVASPDFINEETGKPEEWEIRKLGATEADELKQSCMKQVKNGRVTTTELDTEAFSAKLAAASVVYPNLKDAELQNEWNVMGAENLLKEMLSFGEYTMLVAKVTEHNGFNVTMNDLVEEAKN